MSRKRAAQRARSTVGLGKNGRIDWENWINKSIAILAARRYHAKFIGQITGLTTGQIYSRCKMFGIVLRDSRNGDCEQGRDDMKMYNVNTIKQATIKTILRIRTPK